MGNRAQPFTTNLGVPGQSVVGNFGDNAGRLAAKSREEFIDWLAMPATALKVTGPGLVGRSDAGQGNAALLSAGDARGLMGLGATDSATFGSLAVTEGAISTLAGVGNPRNHISFGDHLERFRLGGVEDAATYTSQITESGTDVRFKPRSDNTSYGFEFLKTDGTRNVRLSDTLAQFNGPVEINPGTHSHGWTKIDSAGNNQPRLQLQTAAVQRTGSGGVKIYDTAGFDGLFVNAISSGGNAMITMHRGLEPASAGLGLGTVANPFGMVTAEDVSVSGGMVARNYSISGASGTVATGMSNYFGSVGIYSGGNRTLTVSTTGTTNLGTATASQFIPTSRPQVSASSGTLLQDLLTALDLSGIIEKVA